MTFPKETQGTPVAERRFFACPDIEVRAAGDAGPTVLIGYAALFDELSDDLGGFREKIAAGAFAKAVGGDVRALFNHDPNLILGRTRSKTLVLAEDNRGLRCEITLPNTSIARDLAESIRLGDVDQMSFGFRTKADKWEDINGKLTRTLLEVELFDVSPVTFPAYPQTEIAKRSLASWQADQLPPVPDYAIERRRLELLAL
ncbi:HK97 family phage prohead protease [Pararhodobacter zhoushanensis]|uniref:HK97 family phage prohead protease n=1 Tax=Pararhodobacter zhoushanensis TaxID=2479545 RepID=A0ABT3GYH5_9RHOB|nr:HK97 family phage prohead protease [Pararhodobacter zhoushanensis]MCW1932621.1 HK97 family phage prohead protease [Pararhodobacter zhoushanensis]